MKTAADQLVAALHAEGVEHVFGYPGGAVMPIYDALVDAPFEHILTRHEQGAALAADGYARASGRVGVCLATSGPGATNLVTGIANAYLDSVPVVAITGQVPRALMGTDAFQEVDTLGITMPICKHGFLVDDPAKLGATLHEAFAFARSGRPGPVVVDVPKDVASGPPARDWAPRPIVDPPAAAPSPEVLEPALQLLRACARPILYVGGGVGIAGAVPALRRLVESSKIPVVCTLKGLGAVSTEHPLFLGMLGMHGTKAANYAVQQSDLLIVAGARFDDRATGRLASFAPGARVIHLDIDQAEVGKLRRADAAIVGDLTRSLEALTTPVEIDPWRSHCAQLRLAHPWRYDAPGPGVFAPRFLRRLGAELAGEAIIACDVGQHQMWVAQHCRHDAPERHLSSGGLGTMGFGLPAAIGAALARPDRRCVCITGDGSFLMNVQELATVRRYGLPLKIVVLDNAHLGMVRQWQELFFGGRLSAVDLSDNPDFVEVARSFGMPAFRIEHGHEEAGAVERIVETPGPLLVHVCIDPAQNVWPLVAPGRANDEMLDPVP